MTIIDIVIIFWVAGSLISGVRMGFVYKMGTLIGFMIGLSVASRYTPTLAEQFAGGPITTAVIFLAILGLVSKLFGALAFVADKVFKFIAIIPFLKTFNRVLGGLISVVLTCALISSGLFIADKFSNGGEVSEQIHQSSVAITLMRLSVFYEPFLSDKLEDFYFEESGE